MSIQDLGSIGELVGATAVVISLIYLAIQVRQNTAERRVEAFRGAVEDFSKFRHMVIQHPELTELGRKSINELSDSEKARFELLIEELAWASNGLFYFVQKGQIDQNAWDGAVKRILKYLDSDHGLQCWNEWKFMYGQDFVAEIESRLTRRPT